MEENEMFFEIWALPKTLPAFLKESGAKNFVGSFVKIVFI